MDNKARLYFEAHITVDSKDLSEWDNFEKLFSKKFRCSRFDEDHVDNYNGKWFMSARDIKLDKIKQNIKNAIDILIENDYNVVRWKIEDTVLDSKYNDSLD